VSEVEDIEIRLLLDAINARYGYDLRDYASASMRRRVLASLAAFGVPHLGELQHRVLCDREFFASVLDQLTVRVTEMFRDPSLYRVLRTQIAPILRTYPVLRIWHCGCATGEEVYASSILLKEESLYERVQLYGTDLSTLALEHAKEGVYSAKRAVVFSENYIESGGTGALANYYTEAYDQIALHESLKKNILFFPHNLVSDNPFGDMQVIFCRNVLIYFNQALRDRVLEKIADSLCPGGFLCLGSSERLDPDAHPQFAEFSARERIYRRAR